ncbi:MULTISPECIES: hypothetical protein [unclassified Tolypothrix]|uniref:hypothetical protein n=1 Tax=unclassified Tolypothrix TaxID=2649714 RepID=UPI0005EABF6B|nr:MULTISPECIES: hypothetical protein [unclassified Tolypothrix]BAY91584.1 hypothetical protein NIES3275_36080 [Microchaete diplosiphon NIES-3275]EKF05328.1 hypothetical protein FDUTEX481_01499 [Tolypothrix sp. PCC 7601]MBE9086278.1 hypothetical protein [Tolypothrix sp. LEGE 11397]UYD25611.1 hypothetical protein HGR01_30420 [Tolypothrix sp. PCC 7712]UYD32148.1 hypothetical protein HG267_24120 [Tolypothrix sp. PCC 7601]
MNKFVKGVLFALVIATPVAIAAPSFQAEAATQNTTHHLVSSKTKSGKSLKHKHLNHHLKKHTSTKINKK